MATVIKGHRLTTMTCYPTTRSGNSWSATCECGWSVFRNRTTQRKIRAAHADHKDEVVWLAGHCPCGAEIDNGPGLCPDCIEKGA